MRPRAVGAISEGGNIKINKFHANEFRKMQMEQRSPVLIKLERLKLIG